MRGKLIPLVVIPGLGIERGVFALANGIVPLPTAQSLVGWMIRHQDTSRALWLTVSLLKHCELIGVNGHVFVNASLDMPTGKVAAVASREGPRSESSDRCTLPIAIIDIARDSGHSCLIEGEAERSTPCGIWDGIASP